MQIAIVFADFLWRAGVGYKIGNDAHMFEGFIWGGWRGQVTPPYRTFAAPLSGGQRGGCPTHHLSPPQFLISNS